MTELVQAALDEIGIDDRIVAAGEFEPRGHSGSAFLGGLVGDEVGGSIGGAVGTIGGRMSSDAASGLPSSMIIGVSDASVYGFAGNRVRLHSGLLFRLDRASLTVEVHQRVNVRVVELVDAASGSRLELEGNRLPLTHSKDVIDHLR
jgi:hypothetical protein